MVYSTDFMHLNLICSHVSYAINSDFSSASSVQQCIIPERLKEG